MNAQQILLTKNSIREYQSIIVKMETDLANPRARPHKNAERAKAIAELNEVIGAALKRLFDAGVITLD